MIDKEDIIAEYEKQLQKKDNEIERLNKILEDINLYIKARTNESVSNEVRIELRNIELMSKGIVKVVREEK